MNRAERNQGSTPVWWKAIKSLNLPLFLVNNENLIIESSKPIGDLLGYTASQLKRKTLVQITHESDRASETNLFIDMFYGSMKHHSCVKRLNTKSGDVVNVSQNLYPIKFDDTIFAIGHLMKVVPENQKGRGIHETQKYLMYLSEKLKSTISIADPGEFGSNFNEDLIQKANRLVNEIQLVISKKELIPVSS